MIETTVGIDGMQCGMCEAHVNDMIRAAFPVKKSERFPREGSGSDPFRGRDPGGSVKRGRKRRSAMR